MKNSLRILALIISLVLVFFATSCDIGARKIQGEVPVSYEASYEEVKGSLALISEQKFDWGEKFILFDFLEGECDINYSFFKVVPSHDHPTSLEEFFDYSRKPTYLGWSVDFVFEDACLYLGDGSFHGGEGHTVTIELHSFGTFFEIDDPDLLVIEKKIDYVFYKKSIYHFNYNGETVYQIRSCNELSDDMLEAFRGAILDAYTD